MAKALYSMDGVNWIYGEDIDFPPNYKASYNQSLQSPQEARFIRIVVSIHLKYEIRNIHILHKLVVAYTT